ncbi:hypothetical protein [Xenorhabdus kozodoii]|uniref:Uncharacterized protein n=1 Tax=Xenorhabdus kozodoii TaxID=351676 RepID=A0A2D0KZJ8_9GAMM|nr:hypothetical protein [Xenorhabdus kozodoii]PHM68851.1 hypothetical protein Xkoz_03619 [Xenorhabdus kozodoii]
MRNFDYNTHTNPNKKSQQQKYTEEQIAEHSWQQYQREVLGREGVPSSDMEFRGGFYMNGYPRRSTGCYVPKDPAERQQYLGELVAAITTKTPHPAVMTITERVIAERIWNISYRTAFNPPLPQHMAEQRTKQEQQAWRDYYATHHTERDHYRGDSPNRHRGGIWTGD